MKRADRLARHYIRAADLRAVYVATTGRSVRIGMTREPEARARELRRVGGNLRAIYWCVNSADAAALIHAACDAMPGLDRGVIAGAGAVKDAILKLAGVTGLALADDATVRARAAAVVADIDDRVMAMQATGQLRGLNAGYRAARADAVKRGTTIMSYGDYLERYKIKMLYEVALAMHRGGVSA